MLRHLLTPITVTPCRQCDVLRMYASGGGAARGAALPRITLPHVMQRKLERAITKRSARQHQEKRFYKGPVVISSKNKEKNHYRGHQYVNFGASHLTSQHWKGRRWTGDYFTVNSHAPNPALHDGSESFGTLGVESGLLSALTEMGLEAPTDIQCRAIPALLDGKSVICTAETGSGKTLAYLLPILTRILQRHKALGSDTPLNAPHAIVIVPNRELAAQIHGVAQQVTAHCLIKCKLYIGGEGTKRHICARPKSIMDVLVTTPGVFSKLLTNRLFDLSNLHHIVLDEADTLMDDSFSSKLLYLIKRMKFTAERLEDDARGGTQLALVGATLPRDLHNVMRDVVPLADVDVVSTDHVHRVLPHVAQKFIRMKTDGKPETLVRLVARNLQRNVATLVFCNKAPTAMYCGRMLKENGVECLVLHGDGSQKERAGRFEAFQRGDVNVLVCTDVASRGLDTIRAQHVINYDFPHFASDYIHRVGRVGRVGSRQSCAATSFVTHKWDVDLLWNIESSVRRSTELYNVNANIKRKLVGVAQAKAAPDATTQPSDVSENEAGAAH